MIKHNLKLILRNLWTRRVYTSVILLSLTVGFVCANILISFLVFETNTDAFHTKRDRVYQLFSNDPFAGAGRIAFVPSNVPEYLTGNYAEVEKVCQIAEVDKVSIEIGTNSFSDLKTLSVDSSFFALFDFPVMHGNTTECLMAGKIVLSQDKARVLFGEADAVGRELSFISPDTTVQLVVSAVFAMPVENSHLMFDALVHKDVLKKKPGGGATYALLQSSAAALSLRGKINKDPQRPGLLGAGKMDYFFTSVTESYFSLDNKLPFMKTRNPMFIAIGYVVCGLILFIASFNFINLFLLYWQNRKKEIGIKKTLGVSRGGLFGFSVAEAAVYIIVAFLLSSIVSVLVVPVFNFVFETNLSLAYFLNVKVVSAIGAVLLVSGMMVVIVAVTKQWNMKPVSLITKGSSKVSFNKLLFTIQFVISITLSICAVTIIQQMDHIENAPLGFNRHIIQLNSPGKKFAGQLAVLKQKVSQLQHVNNVAVSTGNPVFGNYMVRYDLEDEKFYTATLFSGDEDFMETLDLTLIEGELPSEVRAGKLVNQTLVKQFNLKNPVGEKIPGTEDVIIGVVKDFTCGSFKQEIPPAIISYSTTGQSLLIDYKGKDLTMLFPPLQAAWKEVFPDHIFGYKIMQEELMKKYKEDSFIYKIIVTFSIITMVLSCFGLFALSWAVVQSRTKEMGIRKVLGATALNVLNLLTLTFIKRILAAFLIAAPIGYYLMSEWLTRFANRIDLDIWIFVSSGLAVTVVAFATLSLQTVKAAMTNPVDEIRNE